MHETIREGFDVFLHDGEDSVGAVRKVFKTELVVYVENAGDFEVPFSAVKDAEAEKVILDSGKLPKGMLDAIRRRHSSEDPTLLG
ncbi:MAG TPA: hypothetical protein VG821_00135 [Rhizomicrobium sp.]|nr:hypothetical protein [Rhizomicrobium sp.]